MTFLFSTKWCTLILLHDEKSIVSTSSWNMTFLVQHEVVDPHDTSWWKVSCYYLIIKHDFRVQCKVVHPQTTSWWKVCCYYLIMKHDFFRSAWSRRPSCYPWWKVYYYYLIVRYDFFSFSKIKLLKNKTQQYLFPLGDGWKH